MANQLPNLQDDFGRLIEIAGRVPADWANAQPEIQEIYPGLLDKIIWFLAFDNRINLMKMFDQNKDRTFENYVNTFQDIAPRFFKEQQDRESQSRSQAAHIEELQKKIAEYEKVSKDKGGM